MKNLKIINFLTKGYILISGLAFLSVSLMALISPQAVMDLVQVQLSNPDAFSSIRGVYGGVGMALFISLIYLMFNNPNQALVFLAMLWGFYAFSRIITIMVEGRLGSFGNQWLFIEGILFLIAIGLYIASNKPNQEPVYLSKSLNA
ncbi:MAG TPA: DUF4345 domain-containing protein [Anditalea sp.]|nr:DUF4345 domain-containing protein [Anditalea sp.]